MKYILFYFFTLVAVMSLVVGCDVPKLEQSKSKEATYSAEPKKQEPTWKKKVNTLFDEAKVSSGDRKEFFASFKALQNSKGSAFLKWGLTSTVNDKLNKFKKKYSKHTDVFSKVQAALPEPYNFSKPSALKSDSSDYSVSYSTEEDVLLTALVFKELLVKYLPPPTDQATASSRAAKLMGLVHNFVYYGKEYEPFSEALLSEGVLDFHRDTLYTYAKEWKRVYEKYVEETTEPEEAEEECVPSFWNAYCAFSAEKVSSEQSEDPKNVEVTRTSELWTPDEVGEEAGLSKYKHKFDTWLHTAVFAQSRTHVDHTDTVRALVEAGEDVDALNKKVTALFEAVHWHNNKGNDMLSMVLALLKAGADPNFKTLKGTPLEVAKDLEARYPHRNFELVVLALEGK